MKKIALLLSLILLISIFCGCINDDSNKPKLVDSDKDGIPDSSDAFPDDPAASIDSDNDGYPDEWNHGKNQDDSTSNPPLEIDDLPNNPDDWKDSDGDKVGDKTDAFPDDPTEWSDLDEDGIGDNSDINPSVDLSISVSLNKFKVTKKVDLFKWAQVYFDIIIESETKRIDNNGKLWNVWINREQKVDHDSFVYDIPDDTKKDYTNIEIIMYDHDLIGPNDVIDISSSSGQETIVLKFDNIENKISYENKSIGSKGIVWFDITNKESNDDTSLITKTYSWNYDSTKWEFSLDIPQKTYDDYRNSTVNRIPQNQPHSSEAMARFVTSDEKVIHDLAEKLESLADSKNYNLIETINFILSFVQLNVDYVSDNLTKGCIEYWRFPVETLVDKQGDCEDSSVLFASIIDILDYDTVLLFYVWEEDDEQIGHLAVGVHLTGNHGHFEKDKNGKKYFYCETASNAFYELGRLPPEIKVDPKDVIPI